MEIVHMKILLIEDDEEDALLLKKLLARNPLVHYNITWKPSYKTGLSELLTGKHDICLVDYRLGTENGIDLVKAARHDGHTGPIILLTGANGRELDITALQAGADDYITKGQLHGDLLHRIIPYAIERKKAENERERLLSEQIAGKELERRRNEFISVVVHELKTPLTSLKGYAQLLHRKNVKAGDEQSTYMTERIISQVDKLTNLINDLLDATRVTAGQLTLHEELFPFDELVEEIVSELQLTTEQQTIYCEGKARQTIWGDRTRIGQVISNLLSNAIKYASRADRILVKTTTADNTITLCVQDFGHGIPKELQEKVFDPFYRVEKTGYISAPGLGLGLHIATEIIRQHKGSLWLESAEGKGTTFCFTLPAYNPLELDETRL
jgi:signal transduction histidine kinase